MEIWTFFVIGCKSIILFEITQQVYSLKLIICAIDIITKAPSKRSGLFFFVASEGSLLEFLDLGLLAAQTTEVVDARLADCALLVEFDVLNHGGGNRETSFNTDVVRNLTDGESAGLAVAATLQDDALELLQALFLSFNNLVGHRDGVACLELRKIFYNDLIFNELN